jgi:sugar phosphate isomerase/epimerase
VRLDGFALDAASLAGPLEARLAAIRAGGFEQVVLGANDVAGEDGGTASVVAALRATGLRPAAFGTLCDFEGLSGPLHRHKIEVAKTMIETCAALGAPVLLVSASTSAQASTEPALQARSLAQLATLAVPYGVRIAYQALPWARSVRDHVQASELADEVACANFGLGLDTSQTIIAQRPLEDLELLDPRRIHFVQLADVMWPLGPDDEACRDAVERHGVLPGEGTNSQELAKLVVALDGLGYRGVYGLGARHDDFRRLPREAVVRRARSSALWLNEDVLRRLIPLPHEVTRRAR